jgi:hypothetical protein
VDGKRGGINDGELLGQRTSTSLALEVLREYYVFYGTRVLQLWRKLLPIIGRLPHRLGILPSRDRRGRLLPAQVRRALREVVADWFARAFPGSTEDRMQVRPRLRGRWGVGTGVTVEEVEEVWAYCTAAEFRKHKVGLVRLAERVATEGDQEAVAILVDGGMELVAGKETS